MPEHVHRHVAAHGDRVEAGPCRGLRYPEALLRDADAPVAKLRGTYEQELTAALESGIAALASGDRRTFLDLGTADGYFAVGIALRAPGTRVVGFDLARSARRATSELAKANGVSIELRSAATADRLMALAGEAGLVLCDIEGAEVDVLTPAVARALRHAHVIVEVHEGSRPGATASMRNAFGSTHELERIDVRVETGAVGPGEDEMRGSELHWLVCRPLST